ncbi:MAG: C39 family peptidase [Patescibacteria group bacterium]|jgi:hypothetical protein
MVQRLNKKLRKIILVIIILLIICAGLAYLNRSTLRDWYNQKDQEPVPPEISVQSFQDINTNTVSNNENVNTNQNVNDASRDALQRVSTSEINVNMSIPDSINLAVPFTVQAPYANWNLPYQEACEEASMLMSARFLQNRSINGASDADKAILELVNYNANDLKYPIDMTAAETAKSLEQFYGFKTELIYDFTLDDIKQALAQGYPVILPAAGRQIGNPYYTAPGPVYHMLVIKGYTATKIITNDPGTKRGANYQYKYETLYKAAHDWNNGDVNNGQKVIIIVKP